MSEKKGKILLFINKGYTLTKQQENILSQLKNNRMIKVRYCNRKELTTIQYRKRFKKIASKYNQVLLFDIFHLTVQVEYLLNQHTKTIFIIHNEVFDISRYFQNSYLSKDNLFYYYHINSMNIQDSNELNRFLKKSIQKIGRDKLKENTIKKGKTWQFGRPKDKKRSSKYNKGKRKSIYDKNKDRIRYMLKRGKTHAEVVKEIKVKEGSISGLKYYIQTRFRSSTFTK